MSIAHHGRPIYDRPQAPHEHRVSGLGPPNRRMGGGRSGALHGWMVSIDVTVGRINQELARTLGRHLRMRSGSCPAGSANGYCARDSIKTTQSTQSTQSAWAAR
jgi:hypothetical protein